jgi:hypothetical protein
VFLIADLAKSWKNFGKSTKITVIIASKDIIASSA